MPGIVPNPSPLASRCHRRLGQGQCRLGLGGHGRACLLLSPGPDPHTGLSSASAGANVSPDPPLWAAGGPIPQPLGFLGKKIPARSGTPKEIRKSFRAEVIP